MRTVLPLALVLVSVLALAANARGEDPAAPEAALASKVDLLAKEVAYLRGREARITTYILANGGRADALETLVNELRAGGFAAAANPSPARERLLKGLADLAKSLRAGLPSMSESEKTQLANLPK